jgi:hypothetical protein
VTKNLTNGLGIVLATAAFAAALPTVASAAFPGENGMIAMGCSTLRNAICVTEPGLSRLGRSDARGFAAQRPLQRQAGDDRRLES